MNGRGPTGHEGIAATAGGRVLRICPKLRPPSLSRATASGMLLFCLCYPLPAYTGETDNVSERFVGQLNDAIRKASLASADLAGAAGNVCEEITSSWLDLATMMKTVSVGAIDTMDAEQRSLFRTALVRRLVRDCIANAADYLRGSVELAGSRPLPSGETLIGTRGQNSSGGRILMWQVRKASAGRLLVRDLLVDGRSATLSLREQSTLSLERSPSDIAALIATLER